MTAAAGRRRVDDQLLIPGAARQRPALLELLIHRGVELSGLVTEEGRLDALYREMVRAERGEA